MKPKDKELLLKDLLGRVLYGVKVDYHGNIFTLGYNLYLNNSDVAFENYPMLYFLEKIESVKPYLRPMSSMTEKEREEWHDTFESVYDLVPGGDPDNEDDYDDNWHEQPGIESYDYLIAHHFDYRGLIPKGLALEAPEDMYKLD